jgi:hypothetical protein
MDGIMTIERFHALLTSDKGDGSLLTALRGLTATERVEEIVAAILETAYPWYMDPEDPWV